MSKTHKRPPYLEIAVTLATLVFLSLVILGGFDQRRNEGALLTLHSK
jgi:hypothetical protein